MHKIILILLLLTILAVATKFLILGFNSKPETDRKEQDFDLLIKKMTLLDEAINKNQEIQSQQLQKLTDNQNKLASSLNSIQNKVALLENNILSGPSTENVKTENNQTKNDKNSLTPENVPEVLIGQYLESSLTDEALNDDITGIAVQQTQDQLHNLPGVNLETMQCSERYCRAKFNRVDGELPDLSDLWGTPPFMNQGFTLDQDDGSVILFFTNTGVTIDDLRKETFLNSYN